MTKSCNLNYGSWACCNNETEELCQALANRKHKGEKRMLELREMGAPTCTVSVDAHASTLTLPAWSSASSLCSAPCWGEDASSVNPSAGYQHGCLQKLFNIFYFSLIARLLLFTILHQSVYQSVCWLVITSSICPAKCHSNKNTVYQCLF